MSTVTEPLAAAAYLGRDDPRRTELAVEVRSPGTWRCDVGRKRALYEHDGVRQLWLADTSCRTLLAYRRGRPEAGFDVALELGVDEVLGSPLLPGFSVGVGVLLPLAS